MRRSGGSGKKTENVEGSALSRLGKRAVKKLLSNAALLNGGVNLLERSPFGDWLLLLIFEGEGARQDAERARRIVKSEGGSELGDGPARRWYEHRYSVSFKQIPVFRAGAFDDTMEVAAPWSRFEELFTSVRAALAKHVLVLAHISHVYPDGCSVYFTFGIAPGQDASMLSVYDAAWSDALAAVQAAGGAISHHHGIGRSKAEALESDLCSGAGVLRSVLAAFDPDQVMNPGVLLPRTPRAAALDRASAYPEPGLDQVSQLVTVEGHRSVRALEGELQARGYTLGVQPRDASVGDWLAAGMPGAPDPWLDPVDHTLAGLQATLHGGTLLTLPPLPRRATGPDLSALLVGAAGRIAKLERATLRVRPKALHPPAALPFHADRSPPVGQDERDAFEALVRTLNTKP
jgi:alkyldihydroxyacetonephosphate synthase